MHLENSLYHVTFFLMSVLAAEAAVENAIQLLSKATTSYTCDIIECRSDDFQYHRCPVRNGFKVFDINIEENLSSRSCKFCESFGTRGTDDMWVDRGCSAKFKVCSIPASVVVCDERPCSSDGYYYNRCPLEDALLVVNAYMARQVGQAPCQRCQNFGTDMGAIWADKSCNAIFDVCYIPAYLDVACSGSSNSRNQCPLRSSMPATSIQLLSEESQGRCQEGTTYGHGQGYVWTSNGCSGSFRVHFTM